MFYHRSFYQLNMSNHFLPARGADPPFSHKSVVSITYEQNTICSKTLICRQLFAGHVVTSRPIKRKEKTHRMIIWLIGLLLCLHGIIVTSFFHCFISLYFLRDYHQPLAKINNQLKILMERIIIIINISLVGINHGYRSSRL